MATEGSVGVSGQCQPRSTWNGGASRQKNTGALYFRALRANLQLPAKSRKVLKLLDYSVCYSIPDAYVDQNPPASARAFPRSRSSSSSRSRLRFAKNHSPSRICPHQTGGFVKGLEIRSRPHWATSTAINRPYRCARYCLHPVLFTTPSVGTGSAHAFRVWRSPH